MATSSSCGSRRMTWRPMAVSATGRPCAAHQRGGTRRAKKNVSALPQRPQHRPTITPRASKGPSRRPLAIFYLKNGADKAFIRERALDAYYPEWSGKTYAEIHDSYTFNSTCPGTVGPAILSFEASKDYVDCLRLAISLGGDADTLAAIAGPMAYAFYREMPDSLVYAALKKLPDWMVSVNERFDKRINEQ